MPSGKSARLLRSSSCVARCTSGLIHVPTPPDGSVRLSSVVSLLIVVRSTPIGTMPSCEVVVPFERCNELVLKLNFLYCGPASNESASFASNCSSTAALRYELSGVCGRRRICDSVHPVVLVTLVVPYEMSGMRLSLRKSYV